MGLGVSLGEIYRAVAVSLFESAIAVLGKRAAAEKNDKGFYFLIRKFSQLKRVFS